MKTGRGTPRLSEAFLEALIAEATVDAYNASEQEGGFHAMLEERMPTPFAARVIGRSVEVDGFDMGDHGVIAVVRDGRGTHRVHVLDLEFDEPTPPGLEWIEAYRRWARGQG